MPAETLIIDDKLLGREAAWKGSSPLTSEMYIYGKIRAVYISQAGLSFLIEADGTGDLYTRLAATVSLGSE